MVKINDDGRVHQSFVENYPGTPFPEVRFWPYWDGSKALATLKHAIKIIEKGVYRKNHMCQQYFRTLPNGNSFDDLWGGTPCGSTTIPARAPTS